MARDAADIQKAVDYVHSYNDKAKIYVGVPVSSVPYFEDAVSKGCLSGCIVFCESLLLPNRISLYVYTN